MAIQYQEGEYNFIKFKGMEDILNVEELQYLINMGCAQIQSTVDFSDIILGNTGSGKSTLINYLIGAEVQVVNLSNGHQKYLALQLKEKDYSKGAKIGHSSFSTTSIPHVYTNNKENKNYWDCPGFEDTNGPTQDIANGFYIQKIFNNSKMVKIVIVISDSDFETSKSQSIVDSIDKLSLLVPQLENIQESISVICTKVSQSFYDHDEDRIFEISYEDAVNDLRRKLKNLFTEKLSNQSSKLSQNQKLFYSFAQNIKNAGVFFKPTKLSESFCIPKQALDLINSSTKYIATPKIGMPISFKSLTHIQQLLLNTRILAKKLGQTFKEQFEAKYIKKKEGSQKLQQLGIIIHKKVQFHKLGKLIEDIQKQKDTVNKQEFLYENSCSKPFSFYKHFKQYFFLKEKIYEQTNISFELKTKIKIRQEDIDKQVQITHTIDTILQTVKFIKQIKRELEGEKISDFTHCGFVDLLDLINCKIKQLDSQIKAASDRLIDSAVQKIKGFMNTQMKVNSFKIQITNQKNVLEGIQNKIKPGITELKITEFNKDFQIKKRALQNKLKDKSTEMLNIIAQINQIEKGTQSIKNQQMKKVLFFLKDFDLEIGQANAQLKMMQLKSEVNVSSLFENVGTKFRDLATQIRMFTDQIEKKKEQTNKMFEQMTKSIQDDRQNRQKIMTKIELSLNQIVQNGRQDTFVQTLYNNLINLISSINHQLTYQKKRIKQIYIYQCQVQSNYRQCSAILDSKINGLSNYQTKIKNLISQTVESLFGDHILERPFMNQFSNQYLKMTINNLLSDTNTVSAILWQAEQSMNNIKNYFIQQQNNIASQRNQINNLISQKQSQKKAILSNSCNSIINYLQKGLNNLSLASFIQKIGNQKNRLKLDLQALKKYLAANSFASFYCQRDYLKGIADIQFRRITKLRQILIIIINRRWKLHRKTQMFQWKSCYETELAQFFGNSSGIFSQFESICDQFLQENVSSYQSLYNENYQRVYKVASSCIDGLVKQDGFLRDQLSKNAVQFSKIYELLTK